MRRPPSLILRLTLLFGVAAGIVLSGFGLIIERSIEHHFSEEDADELRFIADAVSNTLLMEDGRLDSAVRNQRFSDTLIGHHGAMLYITGQDGRVLYMSQDGHDLFTTEHATLDEDVVYRRENANLAYRVLTRHVLVESSVGTELYTISVAVTIVRHLKFFVGFHRTLLSMIAFGILIIGFMGWFAVRQGHAPLRRIVTQIHSISANQLTTRLQPDNFPRELTDLAVSFNDMLERMDQSFQKISNYSADIAHELRTPVTNLLTQTQVALSQSRTIDEYREILYSNIEEYEHLAQMIGDMLFLAKADNGLYLPGTDEIDLACEVNGLFEFYEAWADEYQISLEVEGNARVSGDRFMLRRAIGNLLSNAIKHTEQGNMVKVSLGYDTNQAAIISVENPGRAIPAEYLPRVFDRFFHRDTSTRRGYDGAGLGLAITKAIVDLHGGNIEVYSTSLGTRFTITLPRQVNIVS